MGHDSPASTTSQADSPPEETQVTHKQEVKKAVLLSFLFLCSFLFWWVRTSFHFRRPFESAQVFSHTHTRFAHLRGRRVHHAVVEELDHHELLQRHQVCLVTLIDALGKREMKGGRGFERIAGNFGEFAAFHESQGWSHGVYKSTAVSAATNLLLLTIQSPINSSARLLNSYSNRKGNVPIQDKR